MDVETLRTFRDVLLHKSITEAAKRSYLTQQTVSKRMASLEKELGCELIRRKTPIEPTPVGRAVLRYADQIVSAQDQMLALVRDISSKPAGHLSLRRYGTNTFARIASGLTGAIAREKQNIELEWVTEDEDDIVLLREGVIDAGFCHVVSRNGEAPDPDAEGISYVPLHSVEFPLTFVVHEGHPILQLPAPSLADIARYPIEQPSFASHGAVSKAARELFDRLEIECGISTIYCASNIGYYPSVSQGAVALASGGASTGFSPEGMGLDFRMVVPRDADYRVLSYAMYSNDNDNPYLPYLLDKIKYIDGCC